MDVHALANPRRKLHEAGRFNLVDNHRLILFENCHVNRQSGVLPQSLQMGRGPVTQLSLRQSGVRQTDQFQP
jgi:hypothetical protein